MMADALDVYLETIIKDKYKKNAKKNSIEISKGVSTKYNKPYRSDNMKDFKRLDLTTETNKKIIYDVESLNILKDKLETYLSKNEVLKTRSDAEKVLISREIKANDQIEDYKDDINDVLRVIKHKELNKENLKKLYSILTDNLLCDYDINHMGDYYRDGPVFIFMTNGIDYYDEKHAQRGVNENNIEKYMNELFSFYNTYNNLETKTDYFIVSQLMHLYFCYIHPYFDVSGRTSRTTALWYLFNNEIYPYTMFNRAISFDKTKYLKVITNTKKYYNMTYFLNYMLINAYKELEKESVMNSIANNIDNKLSTKNYQTIEYFLSMKGNKTIKDYITYRARYNDSRKLIDLYNEELLPLINMGILNEVRKTSKLINNETHNKVLELNKKNITLNISKLKTIKL